MARAVLLLLIGLGFSDAKAARSLNEVLFDCKREEFLPKDTSTEIKEWEEWVTSLASPEDSVKFYETLVTNPKYEDFSHGVMQMAVSRSAQRQATSFAHPRVISYSMGLIFGLVDPEEKDRESYKHFFEGIRYNFIKDEWEPFTGKMTGEKVVIDTSPEVTSRCYNCHGTPFRPIWRSYRAWAGQLSDYEISYEDYKKNRFAPLIKGPSGDPGQMLMMYLNNYNYRRMHARLKENSNWKKFRGATVGALAGCENIPEFFGPITRAKLDGSDGRRFETLKTEVAQTISETYAYERAYAKEIQDEEALRELDQENEMEDSVRMAALRYLFESSGTNIKSFALSRKPGPNSFGYGFNQVGTASGGVHNLLCMVLPDYLENGGNGKEILNWQPYSLYGLNMETLCEELKAESLEVNK